MIRLKKLMSIPAGIALMAFAMTASAQTVAPRLGVQLLTSGLTSPLTASSTGNVVARVVLDTTGSPEGVSINSLPFIVTLANGAAAGTLTNCTVVDEANPGTALSANTTGLVSGLNSVTLSPSLVMAAGTIRTLSLRCDTTAGLVSGGTFTFSMNTANVSATGVSTGLPAVVYVRGATPTPTPIPTPIPVPSVPSTGQGGDAPMNVALLLGSLGIAALGVLYTRKTVRATR